MSSSLKLSGASSEFAAASIVSDASASKQLNSNATPFDPSAAHSVASGDFSCVVPAPASLASTEEKDGSSHQELNNGELSAIHPTDGDDGDGTSGYPVGDRKNGLGGAPSKSVSLGDGGIHFENNRGRGRGNRGESSGFPDRGRGRGRGDERGGRVGGRGGFSDLSGNHHVRGEKDLDGSSDSRNCVRGGGNAVRGNRGGGFGHPFFRGGAHFAGPDRFGNAHAPQGHVHYSKEVRELVESALGVYQMTNVEGARAAMRSTISAFIGNNTEARSQVVELLASAPTGKQLLADLLSDGLSPSTSSSSASVAVEPSIVAPAIVVPAPVPAVAAPGNSASSSKPTCWVRDCGKECPKGWCAECEGLRKSLFRAIHDSLKRGFCASAPVQKGSPEEALTKLLAALGEKELKALVSAGQYSILVGLTLNGHLPMNSKSLEELRATLKKNPELLAFAGISQ